jgi:hypothetical protein
MDQNLNQAPVTQNTQNLQNPQFNQPSPPNKRKILLILIACLALLLIVSIGVAVALSNPGDSDNSNKVISQSPTPSVKPTLIPFPSESEYVEGELIISYEEGQGPDSLPEQRASEIKSIFQTLGVVSEEQVYKDTTDPTLRNFYLLKFKKGVDIEAAAQEIYKIPEVKGAEPNVEASVFE